MLANKCVNNSGIAFINRKNRTIILKKRLATVRHPRPQHQENPMTILTLKR